MWKEWRDMKKIILLLDAHKKILLMMSMAVVLVGTVLGYKAGIFTEVAKMDQFLETCGILAPVIFVLIQAIQVVIPILPGAVGCVYGVAFWGPLNGFIFNYIGICIGSIMAFYISRKFGHEFVQRITGEKFYDKYQKYLANENRFEKIFALLIFLPCAPDDFLCYLAGMSGITAKRFTAIILLGKPSAILLYSIGLNHIFQSALLMIA